MSQECEGVSNHYQLNSLFNSLFRLTTNKAPKLHINEPFERGIHPCPHKETVMWKAFHHHDIIMRFSHLLWLSKARLEYITCFHPQTSTLIDVFQGSKWEVKTERSCLLCSDLPFRPKPAKPIWKIPLAYYISIMYWRTYFNESILWVHQEWEDWFNMNSYTRSG